MKHSLLNTLAFVFFILLAPACNSEEDPNVCSVDNSISDSRISCTETLTFDNVYDESTQGDNRIFFINSIPDHDVGPFPNSQNPNSISPQSETLSVDLTPELATSLTPLQGSNGPDYSFGLALNGVELDPVAAEPWGKGTSNQNWDWNLEATTNDLGLDCNNAHVQPTGAYHYHGTPSGYLNSLNIDGSKMVLVGWAADGFPIYYKYGYSVPDDATSAIIELTSSYQLQSGDRPGDGVTAPCGTYNGKYVQDYGYVEDLGALDKANGRTGVTPEYPDGTFYYVITDDFPGIPRYLRGTPSNNFRIGGPN